MDVSTSYGGIFEIAGKLEEVEELEGLMAQPDFWDNQERAQQVIEQVKRLKSWTGPFLSTPNDSCAPDGSDARFRCAGVDSPWANNLKCRILWLCKY